MLGLVPSIEGQERGDANVALDPRVKPEDDKSEGEGGNGE
jgi:hypothetical protein